MKVRASVAGENLRFRWTTGTVCGHLLGQGPQEGLHRAGDCGEIGMRKLLLSNRRIVIQPTMVEGLPHFFKPHLPLTSRLWGSVFGPQPPCRFLRIAPRDIDVSTTRVPQGPKTLKCAARKAEGAALTGPGLPAKVPPHVATDRDGQERSRAPRSHTRRNDCFRSGPSAGGLDACSGDPKDGDAFRHVVFLTGEGGSWTMSPPVRRARGRGGRRSRW